MLEAYATRLRGDLIPKLAFHFEHGIINPFVTMKFGNSHGRWGGKGFCESTNYYIY